MPKIVQINSTANWGSTGRIAEQIGALCLARGWQSCIAYGRHNAISHSQLIRIGSPVSRAWHLLESRLLDNHGMGSRYATKQLVQRLEEIDPDIIHLHNLHGYYINYPILFDYLKRSRAKVVWTLHDCWSFTGHCAHFMTTGCDKWRSECRDCNFKHEYPKSWWEHSHRNFLLKRDLFTALGDRVVIVPVSQWLAEVASKSLFRHMKIKPIYNGVDTAVFSDIKGTELRQHLGIEHRFMVVGVATKWTEKKGWSDYMELRRRLPEEVAIVLVGVSESQRESLPQGIIGIERTTSQQELAEIYAAADVVLSLSRQETFGLTIAESMACGTPAVVYGVTAMPELITPDTGIVVERVGDIEGVINAINKIKSCGKAHFTEACRRHAEEHFDKNMCFEKYLELYDELLTIN